MNRAASYVAASRHRDSCQLFINSDSIEAQMFLNEGEQITAQKRLETLAEIMARETHPKTTLHYSHEDNQQWLEQQREQNKEVKRERELQPEMEIID